jgi:co-chaperonin GroES (HSP10)
VKIIPLRHKIVVALDPVEARTTASGLHLGESATHLQWGEVLAIGDEVTAVSVNDRVLVNTLLGQDVAGNLVLPDTAVIGTKV